MINTHSMRDVAQGRWLESLYYGSNGVYPKVPYITLEGEDKIVRNAPISMIRFPFSDDLVVALMAQRAYNYLSSRGREKDAKKLSRLTIEEMKRLCEENDIKFYVAILAYWDNKMDELKHYFDKNGIAYIDCNVRLTEANTIKNDSHPDESVQEIWAHRIVDRISYFACRIK